MSDRSYKSSYALLIAPKKPSFATPIFNLKDSNESFIQNFNDKDIVTSFEKIEIENNISSIFYKESFSNIVGNEVVFSFLPPMSEILIGNRSDISKKLENIYAELSQFPFSRYQVASFIKNNELYLKAESEVKSIIEKSRNSLFMEKILEVEYKNNIIEVVKLNKKMYRLVEISYAPRLQAEMSYRAGRAILNHISFKYLSNEDYNSTLSQTHKDISVRFTDQHVKDFSKKKIERAYLTSSLKEAMKEIEGNRKFQKSKDETEEKSKICVLFESSMSVLMCDLRGSKIFSESKISDMADVLYDTKVDGVIFSERSNSYDFRMYLFNKGAVKNFKVTDFYEMKYERDKIIEWINLTNNNPP